MTSPTTPPSTAGPCHEPDPAMPAYRPGEPLSAEEQALLGRLASLVHELAPDIPASAVRPELTLWEIGYDSLALVALRVGVRRAFGAQYDAVRWLGSHEQTPRIGCFVRFLAASGAR